MGNGCGKSDKKGEITKETAVAQLDRELSGGHVVAPLHSSDRIQRLEPCLSLPSLPPADGLGSAPTLHNELEFKKLSENKVRESILLVPCPLLLLLSHWLLPLLLPPSLFCLCCCIRCPVLPLLLQEGRCLSRHVCPRDESDPRLPDCIVRPRGTVRAAIDTTSCLALPHCWEVVETQNSPKPPRILVSRAETLQR